MVDRGKESKEEMDQQLHRSRSEEEPSADQEVDEVPEVLKDPSNSWLSWIYNLLWRKNRPKEEEDEISPISLETSWLVLMSPSDFRQELRATIETRARKNELKEVAESRQIRSSIDWETRFEDWMSTLPEESQNLLQVDLAADLRDGILTTLLRRYKPLWLSLLGEIYTNEFGTSDAAQQRFRDFENAFSETQYEKNAEGRLKGMAAMVYRGPEGSGITTSQAVNILYSFATSLRREWEDLTNKNLSEIDIRNIESVCAAAVQYLIQLHIETARNSQGSREKQGILPKIWAQKDEEKRAKLQRIRDTGTADAKWDWQPYDSTAMNVVSTIDVDGFRSKLEKTLSPSAFVNVKESQIPTPIAEVTENSDEETVSEGEVDDFEEISDDELVEYPDNAHDAEKSSNPLDESFFSLQASTSSNADDDAV